MATLYVMSGVAGVGKSTYLNHVNGVIVSLDAIRLETIGKLSNENDKEVVRIAHERINKTLKDGQDVYFDATNCGLKRRIGLYNAYKRLAKVVVVQLWAPLNVILKQNTGREGDARVPENVIKRMYRQMQPPIVGLDCDDYEFVTNYDYDDALDEMYLYKTVSDKHNTPYHLESISDHIKMVTIEAKNAVLANKAQYYMVHVALAHDLGKWVARQPHKYEDGRDTFIGHENISAMYFMLNKADYADQAIFDRVLRLILFHMIGHTEITDKTANRYKLHDIIDELKLFATFDDKGRITQM